MNDFETLKQELDSVKGERNVTIWNALREKAKAKYSTKVIYELDGSGYIHEWLKG